MFYKNGYTLGNIYLFNKKDKIINISLNYPILKGDSTPFQGFKVIWFNREMKK